MRLTFVHLVDPLRFDPATALLITVARSRGCETSRFGADYGTDTGRLLDEILGSAPDVVLFRIDGTTRDVVAHMIDALREREPELRVALHGPLCERPGELPAADDEHVVALPPDAADSLGALLDGAGELVTRPWDPAGSPLPDIDAFGGAELYRHGTAGAFFGEVGVATLETRLGSLHGAAPDHGLALFNAPTPHPPRPYDTAAILARLEELGEAVRHVEIHDRAFGEDIPRDAALLAEITPALRRRTLTLRGLPGAIGPSFLGHAAPERIRRVVIELWAATSELAGRLPGTPGPLDAKLLAAAIRARGIEVGVLAPVGLPWETPADVDAKLAAIRELDAERVRFTPFEPVAGTPLLEVCVANGMLPTGRDAWNREVYSPLVHDGMPAESWHECWQRCLDLQAELQLARPAALEVAS